LRFLKSATPDDDIEGCSKLDHSIPAGSMLFR
jgi:hypothetical protein